MKKTSPITSVSRIGAVGEVMIELIAGDGNAATLNVAGDTYNSAIYLRRMLPERHGSVSYVTVLGGDRFSDRIIQHATDNKLETQDISRHTTRMPGLYAIQTDPDGERHFTYWRSAAAARTLFSDEDRDPEETLRNFDLILLTGISLAILPQNTLDRLMAALQKFRQSGGLVAFDSNYRPHLWNDPARARRQTECAWRLTDIALPSVDDEMALFGDTDEGSVLARLRAFGVSDGALKRGAAGPMDLGPEHATITVSPVSQVMDTTAAGDSFNAAYLAARIIGLDAKSSLLAGHELAAQVICQRGAIVECTRPSVLG